MKCILYKKKSNRKWYTERKGVGGLKASNIYLLRVSPLNVRYLCVSGTWYINRVKTRQPGACRFLRWYPHCISQEYREVIV